MASGVILERLIGVGKLTVHILLCALYPSHCTALFVAVF
ncbi:hypothetical protein AcetOrient_orf02998 [Acetobacter orientalis]|uniref:Uncharacterized protein n=1 Tax=Acetobacter orientalis TaxID=146474 RepID=A0A2Z5ZIC6_9PROT|nr:hypothetical protein AcetOrient_orf02998 [Acetobacter orientalis]